MPQQRVAVFLNQLLGFRFSRNVTYGFKSDAAEQYKTTYERLLEKIVCGPLHVDETKVSVKGQMGYVWVFTSLEEVVYIYPPNREGDWVIDLLKNFNGVLVSDFYAVYDALSCQKQKCLIHLIRDMNDDLLKEPFNEEMKLLVSDFANLVKPMIKTIERFGLKKRFLRKHKKEVTRFFKRLSKQDYRTDTAAKCKLRLERNRACLFTFLDYDGVPWNNNNAEHAIKAFAMLRREFGGVPTESGIREYLILLSVCESCQIKGVSFLDFLRSQERDVDTFTESWLAKEYKSSKSGR